MYQIVTSLRYFGTNRQGIFTGYVLRFWILSMGKGGNVNHTFNRSLRRVRGQTRGRTWTPAGQVGVARRNFSTGRILTIRYFRTNPLTLLHFTNNPPPTNFPLHFYKFSAPPPPHPATNKKKKETCKKMQTSVGKIQTVEIVGKFVCLGLHKTNCRWWGGHG
jgi:hypothetical protein